MSERRASALEFQSAPLRVGLISDTHGVLRPAALEFLRGCHHIIHGGDIGGPDILNELSSLAPVTAVRGNNDTGAWAERLKAVEIIRLGGVNILAIHDRAAIQVDLKQNAIDIVVFGHSHRPQMTQRDAVLFVNPGSAGPRRFRLPITASELLIAADSARARTVNLLTVP